jgi:hypothetical protein
MGKQTSTISLFTSFSTLAFLGSDNIACMLLLRRFQWWFLIRKFRFVIEIPFASKGRYSSCRVTSRLLSIPAAGSASISKWGLSSICCFLSGRYNIWFRLMPKQLAIVFQEPKKWMALSPVELSGERASSPAHSGLAFSKHGAASCSCSLSASLFGLSSLPMDAVTVLMVKLHRGRSRPMRAREEIRTADGRLQDLVGRKSNQSDRSIWSIFAYFYFFNYAFYFISNSKIKSKLTSTFRAQS